MDKSNKRSEKERYKLTDKRKFSIGRRLCLLSY